MIIKMMLIGSALLSVSPVSVDAAGVVVGGAAQQQRAARRHRRRNQELLPQPTPQPIQILPPTPRPVAALPLPTLQPLAAAVAAAAAATNKKNKKEEKGGKKGAIGGKKGAKGGKKGGKKEQQYGGKKGGKKDGGNTEIHQQQQDTFRKPILDGGFGALVDMWVGEDATTVVNSNNKDTGKGKDKDTDNYYDSYTNTGNQADSQYETENDGADEYYPTVTEDNGNTGARVEGEGEGRIDDNIPTTTMSISSIKGCTIYPASYEQQPSSSSADVLVLWPIAAAADTATHNKQNEDDVITTQATGIAAVNSDYPTIEAASASSSSISIYEQDLPRYTVTVNFKVHAEAVVDRRRPTNDAIATALDAIVSPSIVFSVVGCTREAIAYGLQIFHVETTTHHHNTAAAVRAPPPPRRSVRPPRSSSRPIRPDNTQRRNERILQQFEAASSQLAVMSNWNCGTVFLFPFFPIFFQLLLLNSDDGCTDLFLFQVIPFPLLTFYFRCVPSFVFCSLYTYVLVC